jgi:hypothetical protein
LFISPIFSSPTDVGKSGKFGVYLKLSNPGKYSFLKILYYDEEFLI